MKAIGILGGTFDPIHLGHVQMAQAVMRQLSIEQVVFIPDGDPPHKGDLAPARDRLAMVELAVADEKGMAASDMEISRAGVTYTKDTMACLRREHPDQDYVYLVGADTLESIETWRDFSEVAANLAGIAAVPRVGVDLNHMREKAAYLSRKYGLPVTVTDRAVCDVSSTEVRNAAARQLPLTDMVPPAVEKYIRAHKLYRDPMLSELKRTMTPARYRHTLGVEKTAVELAAPHEVDVEKARTAALLHDCAKYMPVDEMIALVDEAGVQTAEGEKDSRALLHAAAGYVLARTHYGVTDEAVLGAIRWHTTGKKGMSDLEKVIYLADMIEPNRKPFPGIELIREAARESLDKAMAIAARRTVDYVLSRDMPLNVRTLELLGEIEKGATKEETE